MHSPIACLLALGTVAALLAGCDTDQPFQAPSDQGPVLLAAAQKAPSGLAANPLPGAIGLGWQDNSPNETGFDVLRSTTGANGTFTTIATTAANVTNYTDDNLDPAQQYCYQVQAVGQQKRVIGVSATVCAKPLPLQPLAASKVAAVFVSTASVQITWTDNSINENGFRVERAASDAGPWTTLVTTTAGITSAQDGSGIPNQERVCYRVIAFNQYGDSPTSNTSCTAFPAAPTNLLATAVDAQTIDLTWSDNSAFEDGYEVQRCCQTGWIVVANLPANATTYRDGGLVTNSRYSYAVRAKKDQGYSAFSNYAGAAVVTGPPSAPSAYAYPASSSIITVYWYDNSGLAETFRLERSTDGGASWASVPLPVPSQSDVNDEGRTPEQQVCYRVYAANSGGESGPSDPPACTTPPLGPTNLVATTVDYQTIGLTWTDNSAVADGYWVLRYDCYDYYDCGYFIVAELPAHTTNFLDAGLYSDTWYSYYVVAFKDGGTSDYSNEANATTASPPLAASRQAPSTLHVRAASRGLTPGAPTRRPIKATVQRKPAVAPRH
jgi:hypothetical protein